LTAERRRFPHPAGSGGGAAGARVGHQPEGDAHADPIETLHRHADARDRRACRLRGRPRAVRGAEPRCTAFTPVTTEAEFRAAVVGREVVYANGAVGSYGEDGTWSVTDGSGVIGGGTWTWTDERWCSEGSTVDGPVAPACDAVAVSDGAVRFTREDGTVGTLPFRS
jgi:hypothetical protein